MFRKADFMSWKRVFLTNIPEIFNYLIWDQKEGVFTMTEQN